MWWPHCAYLRAHFPATSLPSASALVTKHAFCTNIKLMDTCIYLLPVPLLGLEYVGRVEARGEENTSLWRPAAGEQIGLINVNPLTTLHASNPIVRTALTCWSIGKRGGQELWWNLCYTLAVPHVLCVHHLPSVSSVEACGVEREGRDWISSPSANVDEHDKIMGWSTSYLAWIHHFVYGHVLVSLQCTCVAL